MVVFRKRTFRQTTLGSILLCALALSLSLAASGASAEAATGDSIPVASDTPFPGVLHVNVDATDLDHRVMRVTETLPLVSDQPMVLFYPEWAPGHHADGGNLPFMAGLVITADGKRVEWRRDPVNVHAFHLTPPNGAKSLKLEFQFLTPTRSDQGRIMMTPELISAQWLSLAFYPAGYFARQIPVSASITVPQDFTVAGALEPLSDPETFAGGRTTAFKTVPFDVLVDSPLIAGKYFKRYVLDPSSKAPVYLDVAGDTPSAVEASPEQIDLHKALIVQADRVFGARHFNHYDFLFTLSDRLGGIGLEHHRSSEDGAPPDYFGDWDKNVTERDLLPHEYTHSWNGKYRRPADLWTPDYNVPMQNSLLWVYEGQTEYWGEVLTARSGLQSKETALEALAYTAAQLDLQPGRAWKALQDTTNDPIVAGRRPSPWRNWTRSEDYYREGQLIWLDADTLIRDLTKGQKSLDDFAKSFFGMHDGAYDELTYHFDDVVAALKAVCPYDWAQFLRQRLDGHGPGAPLDGLTRGGYRLIYTEKPSAYVKAVMTHSKVEDFTFSLGLSVGKDQMVSAVIWNSPAFKAGLSTGDKIVAVNGLAYTAERLKAAVTEAKTTEQITLLLENADHFRSVKVAYRGGLRYPALERIGTGQASLDLILAPKPATSR